MRDTILKLTFTNGTLVIRGESQVALARNPLPLEPDYPYECTEAGIIASASMLVSVSVLAEADLGDLNLMQPGHFSWSRPKEVAAP